jgi:CHAD domain-containing protein
MMTNEIPVPIGSGAVSQQAKTIFRDLHRTILSYEAGAAAGAVEAVHDMRVTIRRLRVALSNFAVCLSREDRRRLRTQLENLARALGGVRDLDVMLAALESGLPARPEKDRLAIAAWMQRLRLRRRQRLRRLNACLRGEEYAAFKLETFATIVEEEQAHGQAA